MATVSLHSVCVCLSDVLRCVQWKLRVCCWTDANDVSMVTWADAFGRSVRLKRIAASATCMVEKWREIEIEENRVEQKNIVVCSDRKGGQPGGTEWGGASMAMRSNKWWLRVPWHIRMNSKLNEQEFQAIDTTALWMAEGKRARDRQKTGAKRNLWKHIRIECVSNKSEHYSTVHSMCVRVRECVCELLYLYDDDADDYDDDNNNNSPWSPFSSWFSLCVSVVGRVVGRVVRHKQPTNFDPEHTKALLLIYVFTFVPIPSLFWAFVIFPLSLFLGRSLYSSFSSFC